jgi:S-formylglutathione hydrolase FrmB
MMKPSALWTSVHTRIYLPEGYSTGAPGYTTLYLLHGAGDDYDAARGWNEPRSGNICPVLDTSPQKLITVMPEGGRSGWYTNWVYADLANHRFNWQSFHLDQLRSWVDHHFRTTPTKAGRMVAGASMGGHGALSYAAQRPELFFAAASFSGPGDITDPSVQQAIIANEVTKFASTVPAFGSAIYKSEEGDFSKRALDVQTVIGAYGSAAWTAKNPYAQASKYLANGVTVSLYSGYGGTTNAAASSLEYAASIANDKMFNYWKTQSLTARYCTGVGDHSWVYWPGDVGNWLAYTFGGGTGLTCPHGWGAPRP